MGKLEECLFLWETVSFVRVFENCSLENIILVFFKNDSYFLNLMFTVFFRKIK